MSNASNPYLIRDEQTIAEPGVHSHNRSRRASQPPATPPRRRGLKRLRITLFILGLAGTGYYGYTLADQYVYQVYENWSFDQQIAGRSSVTFADYLREQTPLGVLAGEKDTLAPETKQADAAARPPVGSILGRVSIGRLGISAMVREGVDAGTLSRAVGHVPSTALAGQPGNFSIAAHRDTLFRALKNIRIGDQVLFQSTTETYAYRVIHTQIVRPSDVSVLSADGGPTLLQQTGERPGAKLLTMITCYPFNYIGSAPERFIVQAEAVDDKAPALRTAAMDLPVHPAVSRPSRTRSIQTRVTARKPVTPALQHQTQSKRKKRGFWHRIFSLS